MSPWNYFAILLGVVALCWVAGVFVAIAFDEDAERAQADVEDLLHAANQELTDRPRIKAISEPLQSLHRTHYEP